MAKVGDNYEDRKAAFEKDLNEMLERYDLALIATTKIGELDVSLPIKIYDRRQTSLDTDVK